MHVIVVHGSIERAHLAHVARTHFESHFFLYKIEDRASSICFRFFHCYAIYFSPLWLFILEQVKKILTTAKKTRMIFSSLTSSYTSCNLKSFFHCVTIESLTWGMNKSVDSFISSSIFRLVHSIIAWNYQTPWNKKLKQQQQITVNRALRLAFHHIFFTRTHSRMDFFSAKKQQQQPL